MQELSQSPPTQVAVVVAGAGARGGYEAGVLSVLVPRLYNAGVETLTFVGTSAGAINATIFAALSHLPPDEQAQQALQIWRNITVSDVFRSPITGFPGIAGRFAGQLLQVPGVRLTNLLDTDPLRRTVQRAIDWGQLRTNTTNGRCSLAVVATSGADDRTVVFVDRAGTTPVPPPDDERPIHYVAAQIMPEHVLASSAIPIVFPPVYVSKPETCEGWYLDGGIRLNAPLKPALALGADAIALVATHPEADPGTSAPPSGSPPDVDDVVVRLIDAALVDRMIEDLRTLAKINALVDSTEVESPTGRPRKVIPFLPIGPPERPSLGHLADEIFENQRLRDQGLMRMLRQAELRILGRALGGDGPRRGDLFSYLYFDKEFIEASIELGRHDAEDAFAGSQPDQVPWRIGPRQPLPTRERSNVADLPNHRQGARKYRS
ncbi:patatin-like phospholipase family protein [Rhodococcus olei]|uniref:Patatin-like phospholipase family protein n=1 Tax=Rhodococcus olei TaxID=2161675 RepID=A0ABP8PRM6_9NOCA